jgi:dihydrolipoamide dehydrogenase
VIGCEIASALGRLGTKVTIIEQLPELLAQFDSEAIELLKKDLISNGVQILCGYSVDEIKDEGESLKVIAGKVDRENNVESIKTLSCNADYVLWATGRKAVIPDCELDELKLTDRNFVEVDSNYRTGIDNIYCIGDANGKSMLAHAAIYQAMLVINHICTGKTVSTNPSVPSTVFTNPQIAALGLRESECADKNIAVGKVPYAAVGYSHVIEDSNGYFKIIRDIESDTIIGAEIVGHNACELIHTLAPYINKKLDANMFSDIMLAHPTLTEGIKLAVEASYIRSPQF